MKIGKDDSKFTPHPATDGLVKGVIVDVTPPEKKMTPFGEKDVFRVVIESEVEKAPGERFAVWSKGFTPSLNEKSSFRKFLKLAFGRDVVETDLDAGGELDVDKLLIGHPVQMIIVQEESGENIYANISHVMPDKTGNPLKPSGKHVRKQDRPERGAESEKERAGVTKPAQAGAATAHYGVSKPDWRSAVIPSGAHRGKELRDLTNEELPKFLTQYLDWSAHQSRLAPENEALRKACLEAKLFMDNADPDSEIPF